jgi:CubicO group peptidase (beta-lactamase class C family)
MRRFAIARLSFILSGLIAAGDCQPADAQSKLAVDLQQKIDQVAADELAKTQEPSASIAIVKNGEIAYLRAYGSARLDPSTLAKPEMRYSIGSISKQFTVTAILLLQEQGKLSIDDTVGKFVPGLTQSNKVTIRQLLSHTSGYPDFYAQDYLLPMMLQPTTALKTVELWARKPLDFEPGTKWQYSNTNYTIAGLIVEKASGVPLLQFLQEKVFAPLGMKSAIDWDEGRLSDTDSAGYMRYALGPLRPAPKPAGGWAFAAGELGMTAEDLAKWDISIMNQKVMKPSSYRAFETETLLKNGLGTGYGLGLFVGSQAGHRSLSHSGGFSGYTAQNSVFPDDRTAVVVLTNQDNGDAAEAIASGVATLLLSVDDPKTPEKLAQARGVFEGLQHGTIDRSLLTENANFYFNDQALKDFGSSLGPLGAPEEFTQVSQDLRGGMILRVYSIKCPQMKLQAWTYELPNGKLEQYLVAAQN